MLFKASAPGSLMLLGEYAVLHGGHALVAAINKRIHITLTPRRDKGITISSQLGTIETDIQHLNVVTPFQFVLTTIKKYQKKFSHGFDLEIQSDFSHKIGFSSSAAVTVAMLMVLNDFLNETATENEIIFTAREIIREVQGIGSGADVAACFLGGVVAYRAEPFFTEKLDYKSPMTVIYSGSKTKTADAVAHVKKQFESQPELLQKILNGIDECAMAGIHEARMNHHNELGELFSLQQTFMQRLNVSNATLDEIIETLKQDPAILGAKISGSGLGDCVVGLGNTSNHVEKKINIAMTSRGACCEKN